MNFEIKRTICSIMLFAILTGCISAPTPNSFVSFTDTPSPISTPIPKSTSTPKLTPTLETETVVFEESTSPDGAWTATITRTIRGKNYNLHFAVKNSQNNQNWIVENLDFTEPENPLVGYKYPYVFKWSEDGNYLYYSHLSTGGDGCFGYFQPGGFGLNRFDLSNGNVVEIRSDRATWMALSPDEKRLAYIADWGANVSILNMENGQEQSYPLPPVKNELGMITDTSDLYWAPDGKSLVYAHYIGVCDLLIPVSYIIQLFPDTNQQKILVSHNEEGYHPIEWNIQDKILLQNFEDEKVWLNLITEEITPAD